ncbi:MAG: DUF692 domain-containing protein [Candidatus Devosia euplotis]|nr:DUF692 domain-containing protein [Candidatus Devosia euplotis]
MPATHLPPRAGLGLKPQRHAQIIDTGPDIGFFEVHAENYMVDGGPPHRYLTAIAERYPISLHEVGLSIGGEGPLDPAHLKRLRTLIDCYQPQSFSEHLAWPSHQESALNDLLPLPYTKDTLDTVVAHIDQVQQALGRRMLLENPSTYVLFAQRTGCGLLLDVNSVMVSAVNRQTDAASYIDRFPVEAVGEIHLAGYDETADAVGDRLLIDAHASRVSADVFELFRHTLSRTSSMPTLVEWDNNVPGFDVLADEARLADEAIAQAAQLQRRAS